ncbi:MAG: formyltransferase family protein, partial [Elusimicrobiota bacterium]
MPDGPSVPIRVVVLTRKGRCASARIAIDSLLKARLPVLAVVGEPWQNLVFAKGPVQGLLNQASRHGWAAILKRAWAQVLGGASSESLSSFCSSRGIAYHQVADHNSPECARILGGLRPDILLAANTRILKPDILTIPRVTGLNIHKSLLPRYAGLESIFWALYHGEKEVGVTIHRLDPELDTGDILGQTPIAVGPDDDPESLDGKADAEAGRLLAKIVAGLQAGAIVGTPQDRSQRTCFSWPTAAQRLELKERLSRR